MEYFTTLWTCCLLLQLIHIHCYNIDTDHPLVYSGKSGGYFGYSVALLNNSQGSWVLAGAPKSESHYLKDVNSPGALFKCPLHQDNKQCEEVKLDNKGNGWEIIGRGRSRSRKDFQWLGASLDIKPSFESKITVCAPKWADAKFIDYHYLVNGMCYEMGPELEENDIVKLHPLVVRGKQVHTSAQEFIYGSGMAGFTAHYAQDDSLLLGAPGVNDWKGAVARYKYNTKTIAETFKNHDGYAGYSLSSGRLYGDKLVYYVIGAPRAHGTGLVYVMNNKMKITSKVIGQQVGEGFGSAVEVVDINGDGLDDLIVGAPQYSYIMDEGRVYVFINKDLGLFYLSKPILDGTRSLGARFGTAISNLRDMDLDGFSDIVIGAPYEDGGVGSLYVYNGYDGGLRAEFSQRIRGRELRTSLLGFGASLSRVHDIDGNTYGDFAVGAFWSDNAVVLRGIPVINLEVEIKFSVKNIDLRDRKCKVGGQFASCFTVTVCFQFAGKSITDDIDIGYNVTADTIETKVSESHRISFQENGLTQSTQTRVRLTRNKYSCHQHQAIAFESQDIITPVKFAVSFGISPRNSTKKSSVLLPPVLNKYRSTKASKQILYMKDCGSDNMCLSDLQLETQLILPNKRDYLISGEDSYISHQVQVTNRGELAYLTSVLISYPASLQYVRVNTKRGPRATVCTPVLHENDTLIADVDMSPSNNTLVICDIGNPVRGMETVLFVVKMFVDSRNPEPDPLQIRTVVTTASVQHNDSLSDNEAIDYLLIRLKAGLIVTGISSPEQIRLLRTDLSSSENIAIEKPFGHVYEIGNLGPSLLPLGTMYITVIINKRLAGMVKVDRMEVINPATGLIQESLCEIPQLDNQGLSVSVDNAAGESDSNPRSRSYSYTEGGQHICEDAICISGHCTVRNLQAEASIQIRVTLYVQSNVFVEIQDLNLIRINSSAKFVEDLDPMYIAAPSSDRYNKTISTDLYTDANYNGVNLWALLASVISGFLVIMVIVILLWRGGFFRRKRKEELARLIEERESESGSRPNTIENDNEGMRLHPLRRRNDFTCSGSRDYEEPVLQRNNGAVNGHRTRLTNT